MTKEEAIGRIRDHMIAHKINEPRAIYIAKALEMAIEALEQEPCRDMEEIREVMGCDADAETKCNMISNILNAKSHYFEPKTGHWMTERISKIYGDKWPINPTCSICGGEPYYSNSIFNYKYCPDCGAKMVEPQERSDKE